LSNTNKNVTIPKKFPPTKLNMSVKLKPDIDAIPKIFGKSTP
jgi:hypothetical protein